MQTGDFIGLNLPNRKLAPYNQDPINSYGTAATLIRDSEYMSRAQGVQVPHAFEFSKQGVKPNFQGVVAYAPNEISGGYWRNDQHFLVKMYPEIRIRPSYLHCKKFY